MIYKGFEFPDDATQEEMDAAINESLSPAPSPAPASATATARPGLPALNYNRNWERGALSALPAAGGLLGGIVGIPAGPVGMATMAGLGGAGGEAARQLVSRGRGFPAPESPGEAMSAINREAGLQASLEALGMLPAAGMKALAPKIARAGLRTPESIEVGFQGGGPIDFERTAKTMLRERAPSARRAGALRSEAAENTKKLLDRADRAGVKFSANDIADATIQHNQRRLKRQLTKDERNNIIVAVRDRANELLDEMTPGASRVSQTPGGNPSAALFSPSEVKRLAQSAQDAARTVLGQEAKGQTMRAQKSADRLIAKGAAATKNRVKGVRKSDSRTKDLIALERALVKREASHSPTVPQLASSAAMGAGGLLSGHTAEAPVGALLAYGASSPWMLRRLALGMNSGIGQGAAQQAPLLIETLLRLGLVPPDSTAPPAQEER